MYGLIVESAGLVSLTHRLSTEFGLPQYLEGSENYDDVEILYGPHSWDLYLGRTEDGAKFLHEAARREPKWIILYVDGSHFQDFTKLINNLKSKLRGGVLERKVPNLEGRMMEHIDALDILFDYAPDSDYLYRYRDDSKSNPFSIITMGSFLEMPEKDQLELMLGWIEDAVKLRGEAKAKILNP